ncbi:sulfotransferase [Actinoallomurus acanthiterrae]
MTRLLSEHPDVLGLSEFFVSLGPSAFPEGALDGSAFWKILSRPHPVASLLRKNGVSTPESRPNLHGRLPGGDVPAISMEALPRLTDAPDLLYDRLESEVPRWERASAAEHYLHLFAWLCDRLGRRTVVERSGSGLEILPQLLRCFPKARFVHLHRTGPDCALSMSRHPAFRLAVITDRMREHLGEDPYHEPSERHFRALPDDLRRFLPKTFDAAALGEERIPLADFGRLWSERILNSMPYLASLPSHRLLRMSYEDLLAEPESELLKFARFAELPHPENWARTVSGQVDGARAGGSRGLPESERAELVRSCEPGMRALGLS